MRQNNFDTENWQGHYEKEKLPGNFPHEYRWKNLNKILASWIPPYINRIIHHDKLEFVLAVREWLTIQKSMKCVHTHTCTETPVPDPTYQGLGSLHSSSQQEKSWRNWKSTILTSSRELRSPGKLLPWKLEKQTGRYRKSHIRRSRSPQLEARSVGTLYIVTDELLGALCGHVPELTTSRGPNFRGTPHPAGVGVLPPEAASGSHCEDAFLRPAKRGKK